MANCLSPRTLNILNVEDIMRLWEFSKNYMLRNHNGSDWINDRQITPDDAAMLAKQLNHIATNYPPSYYAKMSNDLLKTFYDRLQPGK